MGTSLVFTPFICFLIVYIFLCFSVHNRCLDFKKNTDRLLSQESQGVRAQLLVQMFLCQFLPSLVQKTLLSQLNFLFS